MQYAGYGVVMYYSFTRRIIILYFRLKFLTGAPTCNGNATLCDFRPKTSFLLKKQIKIKNL